MLTSRKAGFYRKPMGSCEAFAPGSKEDGKED